MATELERIKQTLDSSQDLASFSIIYDRKNKKLLTSIHGDGHLLEQMVTRAFNTDKRVASVIRRVSLTSKPDIPKDFFDIFNKLK